VSRLQKSVICRNVIHSWLEEKEDKGQGEHRPGEELAGEGVVLQSWLPVPSRRSCVPKVGPVRPQVSDPLIGLCVTRDLFTRHELTQAPYVPEASPVQVRERDKRYPWRSKMTLERFAFFRCRGSRGKILVYLKVGEW